MQIEETPLSQEDIDFIKDIIESADHCGGSLSPAVQSIISEEAALFYSGNQDLESTVLHIQSRVSVYISENM